MATIDSTPYIDTLFDGLEKAFQERINELRAEAHRRVERVVTEDGPDPSLIMRELVRIAEEVRALHLKTSHMGDAPYIADNIDTEALLTDMRATLAAKRSTQQEIGDIVGLSQSSVSKYMLGQASPATLLKLNRLTPETKARLRAWLDEKNTREN